MWKEAGFLWKYCHGPFQFLYLKLVNYSSLPVYVCPFFRLLTQTCKTTGFINALNLYIGLFIVNVMLTNWNVLRPHCLGYRTVIWSIDRWVQRLVFTYGNQQLASSYLTYICNLSGYTMWSTSQTIIWLNSLVVWQQ